MEATIKFFKSLVAIGVKKIGAPRYVRILVSLFNGSIAKWLATGIDTWLTKKLSADLKKAIYDGLDAIANEINNVVNGTPADEVAKRTAEAAKSLTATKK